MSTNEPTSYRAKELISGIFGIYKEKGPTSFRVIAEIRRITGVKTVGHAGTLDPLASGVLVVAIGRENTRKIDEYVGREKEYIAKIKLGYESSTDDEEGEKKIVNTALHPSFETIADAINKFIGEIDQVPPIYSAIKSGGRRLYKLARQGETAETVEIKPRKVLIKNIEILRYNYPELELKVITGKGVYIRSLARDIGRIMRTGAYLADLERTRVGEFTKENSITVEEFREKIEARNPKS